MEKYCFRCSARLVGDAFPYITINNPATTFHFKCYFCLQCFATLTQLAINRKDRVFLVKGQDGDKSPSSTTGGSDDAYSGAWENTDT